MMKNGQAGKYFNCFFKKYRSFFEQQNIKKTHGRMICAAVMTRIHNMAHDKEIHPNKFLAYPAAPVMMAVLPSKRKPALVLGIAMAQVAISKKGPDCKTEALSFNKISSRWSGEAIVVV